MATEYYDDQQYGQGNGTEYYDDPNGYYEHPEDESYYQQQQGYMRSSYATDNINQGYGDPNANGYEHAEIDPNNSNYYQDFDYSAGQPQIDQGRDGYYDVDPSQQQADVGYYQQQYHDQQESGGVGVGGGYTYDEDGNYTYMDPSTHQQQYQHTMYPQAGGDYTPRENDDNMYPRHSNGSGPSEAAASYNDDPYYSQQLEQQYQQQQQQQMELQQQQEYNNINSNSNSNSSNSNVYVTRRYTNSVDYMSDSPTNITPRGGGGGGGQSARRRFTSKGSVGSLSDNDDVMGSGGSGNGGGGIVRRRLSTSNSDPTLNLTPRDLGDGSDLRTSPLLQAVAAGKGRGGIGNRSRVGSHSSLSDGDISDDDPSGYYHESNSSTTRITTSRINKEMGKFMKASATALTQQPPLVNINNNSGAIAAAGATATSPTAGSTPLKSPLFTTNVPLQQQQQLQSAQQSAQQQQKPAQQQEAKITRKKKSKEDNKPSVSATVAAPTPAPAPALVSTTSTQQVATPVSGPPSLQLPFPYSKGASASSPSPTRGGDGSPASQNSYGQAPSPTTSMTKQQQQKIAPSPAEDGGQQLQRSSSQRSTRSEASSGSNTNNNNSNSKAMNSRKVSPHLLLPPTSTSTGTPSPTQLHQQQQQTSAASSSPISSVGIAGTSAAAAVPSLSLSQVGTPSASKMAEVRAPDASIIHSSSANKSGKHRSIKDMNQANNSSNTVSDSDNSSQHLHSHHKEFPPAAAAAAAPSAQKPFVGDKRTNFFLNSVCISSGSTNVVYVTTSDSSVLAYDVFTGEKVGTLTGHIDRVLCVACSYDADVFSHVNIGGHHQKSISHLPGPHFIVSGSRDETVRVWDLNHKCTKTIHAHKGPVWSVAAVVRDDIGYCVSCSDDGSIRVWNVATGLKLFNFKGQKGKVLSVHVVDKRATTLEVLSAGQDKNVHVWNLIEGHHVKLFEGHTAEVTALTSTTISKSSGLIHFSESSGNSGGGSSGGGGAGGGTGFTNSSSNPNLVLIISGSRDKTVRVWDYHEGCCVYCFTGHSSATLAIATAVTLRNVSKPVKVCENTPVVICGTEDGTTGVWNLDTGKLIRAVRGHANGIKGLAAGLYHVSNNNNNSGADYNKGREVLVVSCGWDKAMHMFNLDEFIGQEDPGCVCTIC